MQHKCMQKFNGKPSAKYEASNIFIDIEIKVIAWSKQNKNRNKTFDILTLLKLKINNQHYYEWMNVYFRQRGSYY